MACVMTTLTVLLCLRDGSIALFDASADLSSQTCLCRYVFADVSLQICLCRSGFAIKRCSTEIATEDSQTKRQERGDLK